MIPDRAQSQFLTPYLRRLRSLEAAAAAGLLAAVGWLVVLRTWLDAPSVGASDSAIRLYYGRYDGLNGLATLQIMVFSTIGFLWFIGVIRSRIGEAEPKLFGTVFFGGGILLAGLMFVGSAAFATPLVLVQETDRVVDPDMVASTRVFARIMLGVVAPRIASLFIFSLSGMALRTGALPRWLIFVGYAVGVAMFVNVTFAFATAGVYMFPAWMALASVVLLVRPPPGPLAVTH
jgi:hypothetical protein